VFCRCPPILGIKRTNKKTDTHIKEKDETSKQNPAIHPARQKTTLTVESKNNQPRKRRPQTYVCKDRECSLRFVSFLHSVLFNRPFLLFFLFFSIDPFSPLVCLNEKESAVLLPSLLLDSHLGSLLIGTRDPPLWTLSSGCTLTKFSYVHPPPPFCQNCEPPILFFSPSSLSLRAQMSTKPAFREAGRKQRRVRE